MRAKNCLIIETEHYLSESISLKLEENRCNVKIVSSTQDAIVLKENFSLIILSMSLKDENKFFKTIKKFKNSIIILMTSHIDYSYLLKAIDYGANDYILKPFTMDSLIHKISIFQKIKELEDREKRTTKFLSTILENGVEQRFNLEIQLPIVVNSKIEKEIDSFVFLYGKEQHKNIEIISFKDLVKNRENSNDTIYYLREFSILSEKEKIKVLEITNSWHIIIGLVDENKSSELDFSNFNFYKIDSEERSFEISEILTVSDYIKHVILQYQNRMPDTELSKHLGISRKSLWEKRRKFDIQKIRKT